MAGLGISWLRDNLQLISSAAESEWLAETVKDSGGCVRGCEGEVGSHWKGGTRGTWRRRSGTRVGVETVA